jgi:hypothetical protein
VTANLISRYYQNFRRLGAREHSYKQLNSSVGRFGTDILVADTNAIRTGSAANDATYKQVSAEIRNLGFQRDSLAAQMKVDLFNNEFHGTPLADGSTELATCNNILAGADALAAG